MATQGNAKQAELLPPQANGATAANILELAVKQGANVETMMQLLTFMERLETNEARKAFEVAFAAFKQEAPKLERTKEVSFGQNKTAYKYTPLDIIANTLGPILAKHGLSYNWRQTATKEQIEVTCVLRHTRGHSIENTLSAAPDPSGSKNGIQAIGSAVSYLRRYTLLGALGMATSDEDNDGMTMPNGVDFIANIETSSNKEELIKRYREAVTSGLQAKDPNAIKAFMRARDRREKELAAA